MTHPKRRVTDMPGYEDRVSKMLRILMIILVVVVMLVGARLLTWQFWPGDPIVTGPKPYKVVYPANKVVKQGGFITYQFDYEKTGDIVPVVHRQFVDGLVFNVAGAQTPTVIEPGKGTARVQVDIPETLPPGKYHLRILATYRMNPIRDHHNDSITETFEVIPGTNTPLEYDALQENREGSRP